MAQIIAESFWAMENGSKNPVRLRPYPGQGYSTDLRIAFSVRVRNEFPPGTLFKLDVVEVDRQGTLYLRASPIDHYEVVNGDEANAYIELTFGSTETTPR